MSTTILANGSKFLGDPPDTLEQLYAVLQKHPLDPTFERYGNFVERDHGKLLFHGNFFDVSHVFQIVTDDADVIDTLMALIRQNQASRAYRDAKALCAECGARCHGTSKLGGSDAD